MPNRSRTSSQTPGGGDAQTPTSPCAPSPEDLACIAGRLSEAFWITQPGTPGLPLYVSPGFEAIFGQRPQHPLQTYSDWVERIHPEDRSAAVAAMEQFLRGEANTDRETEYRIVRPDGEVRWVHSHGTYVRGSGGEIRHIVGITRDITDRKQAEQELRESRRTLETLLANLPGMAYRCLNDDDWTMIFVSAGCRQLTGYTPEDLVDNRRVSYASLIHPDDRGWIWQTVQERLREQTSFEYEYRIHTADGKEKWIWERGEGVRDASGQIVALEGFMSDVTERKQTEEQLLQAQKMEAIGHLAGGVAHDFRNQLTVVRGYAQMLQQSPALSDEHRPMVEEIIKAADRSTRLTSQLLAFGRREMLQPVVADLGELIADMQPTLPRLIGEDVAVSIDRSSDPAWAYVDPTLVQQAVLNLVINSRDAMPRGGDLILRTFELELSPLHAYLSPEVQTGRYAVIEVTDTGTGMTPEVRERAFEPFFTTKEVGKGTGLGLSMVYGFVRQSGGFIECRSEVGVGTTIQLAFPCASPPLPADASASAAPPATTTGTVLLVEDEDAVRTVIARTLRDAGFTVLDASTASRALDLAGGAPCPIDVILTDVILPGMDGPSLADALQTLCPGVPVVFLSGYADRDRTRRAAQRPGSELLIKPFSTERLLRAVRRALAKKQPPEET